MLEDNGSNIPMTESQRERFYKLGDDMAEFIRVYRLKLKPTPTAFGPQNFKTKEQAVIETFDYLASRELPTWEESQRIIEEAEKKSKKSKYVYVYERPSFWLDMSDYECGDGTFMDVPPDGDW